MTLASDSIESQTLATLSNIAQHNCLSQLFAFVLLSNCEQKVPSDSWLQLRFDSTRTEVELKATQALHFVACQVSLFLQPLVLRLLLLLLLCSFAFDTMAHNAPEARH